MKQETLKQLAQLRLLVGYLGEKKQHNWWPSDFLNEMGKKMLEFTFPRTAKLAQYQAVSHAASLVHDEVIGVGKTYHLFRLPEHIEKALVALLQADDGKTLYQAASSQDDATAALVSLAKGATDQAEGPVSLGKLDEAAMNTAIQKSAAFYHAAFSSSRKSFPYFRDDA